MQDSGFYMSYPRSVSLQRHTCGYIWLHNLFYFYYTLQHYHHLNVHRWMPAWSISYGAEGNSAVLDILRWLRTVTAQEERKTHVPNIFVTSYDRK